RQRGKRAEQVAGESALEQRVRPQLGHLEHRLAAAVGWAQQHVPLVARATAEKRFDGGDEVGVERAVGPLWMTGCGAEALPEFRLERAERARAGSARVHAVTGARAV